MGWECLTRADGNGLGMGWEWVGNGLGMSYEGGWEWRVRAKDSVHSAGRTVQDMEQCVKGMVEGGIGEPMGGVQTSEIFPRTRTALAAPSRTRRGLLLPPSSAATARRPHRCRRRRYGCCRCHHARALCHSPSQREARASRQSNA
eukprot:352056-Chlamydomonas_euryale.AAC.1